MYTDSRGDNIPGHVDYQHYGVKLKEKYDVDMYLCPEKWTTTLDFLKLYYSLDKKQRDSYDYVVLHTGIVDFSPRHQTIAIEKIYSDKKDIFDEVFTEREVVKHLKSDFGLEYEGDKTINLYSIKMAEKYLIPRLQGIDNLVWISCNKIVKGWNGNYWKERPVNIDITEKYSNLFLKKLKNTIDLMSWSNDEVKKYTFDNMHPNKEGSDWLFTFLCKKLK